jgi:ribosomal protein S18 acetylase RimI-like enzyme
MNLRIFEADLANRRDAQGLLDVLDSYAADPVGGGEPLTEDVHSRLVARLREVPSALVLLAFDADVPVGVAVCFFGFSTFRAQPLLNIHDLAVLPPYRGRGIGSALLAFAEHQARRRGCCRLTLEVQDDNPRARALYERFGFEDVVIRSAPTRFLAKSLEP